MYLEMLYNRYGSVLEKQATAITNRPIPWEPSYGGNTRFVRKVTGPTGTVARYEGARKGADYYENMRPSNPRFEHDYNTIPENSPYYNAVNNTLNAISAKKQPSEEDENLTHEYLNKMMKLKRRSVPRYTYIPR